MYVVLEYVVCVALVWVVATCLFGLCVVFILLQEGYRRLRCFIDMSMNYSHAASAKTFDAARGTTTLERELIRSWRTREVCARVKESAEAVAVRNKALRAFYLVQAE